MADPNVRNQQGRTALLQATARYTSDGSTERLLLQSRADANLADEMGRTALHIACWRAHAKVVRLLLQARAQPDVTDHDMQTPFEVACCCLPQDDWFHPHVRIQPRVEALSLLLDARADPQKTSDANADAVNSALAFLRGETLLEGLEDTSTDADSEGRCLQNQQSYDGTSAESAMHEPLDEQLNLQQPLKNEDSTPSTGPASSSGGMGVAHLSGIDDAWDS